MTVKKVEEDGELEDELWKTTFEKVEKGVEIEVDFVEDDLNESGRGRRNRGGDCGG